MPHHTNRFARDDQANSRAIFHNQRLLAEISFSRRKAAQVDRLVHRGFERPDIERVLAHRTATPPRWFGFGWIPHELEASLPRDER